MQVSTAVAAPSPVSRPLRRAVEDANSPSNAHTALCKVGRWLREQDYHFICPTPSTQSRVAARPFTPGAANLRDIFGWNRSFTADLLPPAIIEALQQALALREEGILLRSELRCSSIAKQVFFHSAFPTTQADAVFFGPDTYRFTRLIRETLESAWSHEIRRVVDIGCGSGGAALAVSHLLEAGTLRSIVLCDINPRALALAAVNAEINDVRNTHCVRSDGLKDVPGLFDLIVCNPPYMIDPQGRTYRNGGDGLGTELSMKFLEYALARLAPGGRLVLYTGSAIIHGQDSFRLASLAVLEAAQVKYRYFEIDPDVFGESLDLPEYASVERIAAIGLVAYRPGGRCHENSMFKPLPA